VVKIGTKKTGWINFAEICNILNRDQNHVMNFFLQELGSEGSIAADQLSTCPSILSYVLSNEGSV